MGTDIENISIAFAPLHGAIAPEGVREKLETAAVDLGAVIAQYSNALFAQIQTVAEEIAPDEVLLEFGLAVAGKSNFLIVEGTATGHVKVSVKWTRKST